MLMWRNIISHLINLLCIVSVLFHTIYVKFSRP